MRMRKLPEDIESTCLGSGCPNNCWYCKEPKEVIYKGIPEFTKDKIYLYDAILWAVPFHALYQFPGKHISLTRYFAG